ncbi:MAG: hypothetical protein NTW96_05805 [Planctomycetia bacterium]|nr:hypothetical protein [Planctomycetia bacterium]
MSIWNKVFIGLIIVASLGLFYVSMQALKTHKYWRTSANAHELRLAELPKEIENLKYGTEVAGGSLQALRIELYKELIDRGRVWYNAMPQQVNPQTGEVRVGIEKPAPHGIKLKTVLYVFEATGPKAGGRFLGEFRVKEVAEKTALAVLEPSMTMVPEELQRLQESKGPWTLRELMTNDTHEVFAGLTEQQLKEILPAGAVEEVLNDGKNGKVRQLRDFLVLLKQFDRQRTALMEKHQTALRHKQDVEAAVADAKKQVQFRQDELAALKTEEADMNRQRDAALAHEKALIEQLESQKTKIAKLIDESRAVADEIAKAQFHALEVVDRRAAVASQ